MKLVFILLTYRLVLELKLCNSGSLDMCVVLTSTGGCKGILWLKRKLIKLGKTRTFISKSSEAVRNYTKYTHKHWSILKKKDKKSMNRLQTVHI